MNNVLFILYSKLILILYINKANTQINNNKN